MFTLSFNNINNILKRKHYSCIFVAFIIISSPHPINKSIIKRYHFSGDVTIELIMCSLLLSTSKKIKKLNQFEFSLFECNVNAAFPSCFLFFVIMSTHFTFCVLYSFNSKQSRLKLIRISTRQQYYFKCFLSLEIRRINNLFLYLGI